MERRRQEFSEFYTAFRDDCLRIVLVNVADRQLAEDLVAEAFTRCWMSWRKVCEHPAPRAWVVRTALNTHVSWWRRRRRELTVDDPTAMTRLEGSHLERSADLDLDEALVAALRALPLRQREVITLRVFFDLDTDATAKLLGVSPGTVSSHLHRANRHAPRANTVLQRPGGHPMNDEDMLAAMRSSLTGTKDALTHVHMDPRPEAIMARARSRRLRRGLPGVGAGVLALGIGLALSLSGGHLAGSGGSPIASGGSGSPRVVHVNLAAWSVNTSPTGLVKVTIRELKDPAGLSKTLADAGVPVVLTSGKVCTSGDELQVSRVVRKLPGPGGLVIKINPKAMPAGTELVIGVGTLRIGSERGHAAAFGLEKKGSPLDCHGKAKKVTS